MKSTNKARPDFFGAGFAYLRFFSSFMCWMRMCSTNSRCLSASVFPPQSKPFLRGSADLSTSAQKSGKNGKNKRKTCQTAPTASTISAIGITITAYSPAKKTTTPITQIMHQTATALFRAGVLPFRVSPIFNMALHLCRVTDAFHLIALIQVAVSVSIEPAETFAGNGKRYSQPLRHPADGQKFSQADFIVVVFIGLSDEDFRRVCYVQRIGGGGTATQCKNK